MNYQPWKEAASLIVIARSALASKVGQNLNKQGHIAATLQMDSEIDHEQQQLQRLANQRTDGKEAHELRQQRLKQSMQNTDYRIMMVKRSALSSFMASAYVFPGGQVEEADFSPRWYEVFNRVKINRDQLKQFTERVKGSRPPMMTPEQCVTLGNAKADQGDKDFLHPDIAMRIAAIRETFEETGVLLLKDHTEEKEDALTELPEWRERVRNDADSFIELCLSTNQCPDLWSLYEWWDWLTPISVGHKRFDTMFYVCCLDKQPRVVLDNREVTTLKWVTPVEMLEEHTQERVFLAPPQVYELSRLFHQRSFDALRSYLPEREKYGTERWLPVIGTYVDGAISLLPGDDLYPLNPDFIGKKPVPDFSKRLAEMRSASKQLNRIELTGPMCVAVCNMKQSACGHRAPFSYVKGNEQFSLDSKL